MSTVIPDVIESPIDLFGEPTKLTPDEDTEPRRGSARPERAKKPQQRRTAWAAAADVEKALCESLEFLAGGAMLLPPLEPDAALFYTHGPRIIHEVVELGRSDKRLRLFLEKLAAPGKYGPLALAIFPLVLGIAGNHNLIPKAILGIAHQQNVEAGE